MAKQGSIKSGEDTNVETPPTGHVIRVGRGCKPQIIDTGKRWNDAAEERFLTTLAATCNVGRSAVAAGFSTTAIYTRRLREPGFAARWAEALQVGYMRLELALVEQATTSLGAGTIDYDHPIPKMSMSEAMMLLRLNREKAQGGAHRFNPRTRLPDIETVTAELVQNIRAMRRGRATKSSTEASETSRDGG